MAHILIAEDDAAMRRFLSGALEKVGHDVTAVEDGLRAVEALERGRFDLLLTDIVMPGMDGIALAGRAQALAPDLRVMFITGFSGMAAQGAAPVVAKPFHLRDVVVQVERLLAA